MERQRKNDERIKFKTSECEVLIKIAAIVAILLFICSQFTVIVQILKAVIMSGLIGVSIFYAGILIIAFWKCIKRRREV